MSSDNRNNNNNNSPLKINLKWGKKTFEITLEEHNKNAAALQQVVESLTGVPAPRQKLLAKKAWKGPLKSDDVSSLAAVTTCPLAVTLIGSAETLVTPTVKTTFVEDLSPQEVREAQEAEAQAAWKTAQGMIPALQLLPHYRDDGKQETYVYNRLVTGLPQRQVERELRQQTDDDKHHRLQGKVAMQLGLELRRAYVNDLAVLPNGTCVSVLDDGHVQCWKHAAQQEDLIHLPGHEGPVDSVTAVGDGNMFATAGRGSVQLWTTTDDEDVKPVLTLPSAMPGTSPTHLLSVNYTSPPLSLIDHHNNQHLPIMCLAARLQVTRASNPNQFHLPPQNEAQRQRRAQAEAQERAVQQSLARAARSIQVWASSSNVPSPGGALQLQSRLLEPPSGVEGSAPVTCLVQMQQEPADDGSVPGPFLIAGDAAGGLRIWRISSSTSSDSQGLQFLHHGLYQLVTDTGSGCSIVCLQALPNGRLAVSIDTAADVVSLAGAQSLVVSSPRAVHILDLSSLFLPGVVAAMPTVQSSLTGHSHKDAVICMCALPNGDLLTGGGKMDATLQLWSSEQQQGSPEFSSSPPQHDTPCQTWTEVGYVFALAVLRDVKENSNFYAVAAARYNTVKIIV